MFYCYVKILWGCVARYPYLGSAQRIYMQYADITDGGWKPLVAVPGGAYDMLPGDGQPGDLPVPPGDGLWGPDEDTGGSQAAAAPASKTAKGNSKGGGE